MMSQCAFIFTWCLVLISCHITSLTPHPILPSTPSQHSVSSIPHFLSHIYTYLTIDTDPNLSRLAKSYYTDPELTETIWTETLQELQFAGVKGIIAAVRARD